GSEHVPGRKQTSHVVFQCDVVVIFDEQFSELRLDSPARRTDRICKVNDAYLFLCHLTAGDVALRDVAAQFETGQPRGLTESEPDRTFTVHFHVWSMRVEFRERKVGKLLRPRIEHYER